MKKATIILIAAIYVASIVVVGVFGLQALLYNEVNPITDIQFPEEINGSKLFSSTLNGDNTMSVVFKYEKDLTVPVEYIPVPADSTSEIEITVKYSSDGVADLQYQEIMGKKVNYFLEFHRAGTATVTFSSLDNVKFSKNLTVIVTP